MEIGKRKVLWGKRKSRQQIEQSGFKVPNISCWDQCFYRTGKCWHGFCCSSLQLLNTRTELSCQDQEVCLLSFSPSFLLMSTLRSSTSLHVSFFSSRDHQSNFLESYSANAYMNQQLAHEEAFQDLVACVAPDSVSILHKHVMASYQRSMFTVSPRSFISNDTRGVLLVPGASYWGKWTQLLHKRYPWPSWAELCWFQLALPILTEGKGLRLLPDKYRLFTFC